MEGIRNDVSERERGTEFWRWFAQNAEDIAANPSEPRVIDELDQRVRLAWPKLAWEIGPDPTGDWYLALSPNLDLDMAAVAKRGVALAPVVPGWRFYSTRQRKAWDGSFEIEGRRGVHVLDSSNWRYVLLKHGSGELEVVLVAPEAAKLEPDERWQAAAVVVEGLLGEACVLDCGISFALEPTLDARLSEDTKSIAELPQAFGLPSWLGR